MGLITVPQVSDGDTAEASDINTPVNTIANEFNGNIDNANIKSGAAIATSKLATDGGILKGMLGTDSSWAFVSYSPTLTNITIGNGTSSFYYSQIGKRVLVQGRVTFGSTSSIGGTIAISLPVTAVSSRYASREPLGVGMAFHNGSGAYNMCIVTYNSTTTVHLTAITTVSGTNPVFTEIGSSRDVNASTPFSSAGTSDVFSFNFEYEAA